MFQFDWRYTYSVGVSWGKLYIFLAALRWSNSKDCRRSVFGQPPQTTSPYKTDGNIILKYKSNRAFRLKNELLFKRFSLLTKFLFKSMRVCFTHSIRASPIVTEISGPMCGFLVKGIASHLAEWGVNEFSRHQLFSSNKALFKEVTVFGQCRQYNKRFCLPRT